MPRPKTLPDSDVLEAALKIIHGGGPEALTFASLAKACGLSAATLVQRFGSKEDLKRRALLHAWDHLDGETARLLGPEPCSTPPSPHPRFAGVETSGERKVPFRLTNACDQSLHTYGRNSMETKNTARATVAATMIVHGTTRRSMAWPRLPV